MIYEIRTYTLRTGAVPEFEERYEKRLPLRLKHSAPFGTPSSARSIKSSTSTRMMICSTARGYARRWRKIPNGTRSPGVRI